MAKIDFNYAIGLPPERAIEYFKSLGYSLSFDWLEAWQAAKKNAFTVTGVMRQDVLEDIHSALQKALTDGETLSDFRNRLEPILEQKGWLGRGHVIDPSTGEVLGKKLSPRRLETIFNTNIQTAYQAGRYEQQMADAADRPYLEYVAVMDGSTRAEHAALNGIILPADDPFWQFFYPPNGFNCRCRVRAYTAREIERRGLVVSSSHGCIESVEVPIGRRGNSTFVTGFRNPVNGRLVTAQIGWDHRPGVGR